MFLGLYGQSPEAKLHIEPQFGQAGTIFHFKATHFEPGKQLKVSIIAPNRKQIYNDVLVTDDNGNIGWGRLGRSSTRDWLKGKYTLVVIGESNGETVTLKEFFELT